MKLAILTLIFTIPFLAYSQEGFISNGKGGCKSFTFKTTGKTNSWSGKCQSGYATGYGTLIVYEDGVPYYSYIGEMSNGKFNGNGTLTFANGKKFIGTHLNHSPNGNNNKLYYSDGYEIGEVSLRYELINGSFYNLAGELRYNVVNGVRKYIRPEFFVECTPRKNTGTFTSLKGIYISIYGFDFSNNKHRDMVKNYAISRSKYESEQSSSPFNGYKIYFIDGFYKGSCDLSEGDLKGYKIVAISEGTCGSDYASYRNTWDEEYQTTIRW